MSIPLPIPLIDTCQQLNENHWIILPPPSAPPNDLICCLDFLKQYDHNNATFESYRREIERLLQWTWFIKQKSLLALSRQDMEDYIEFCLDPPKSWIGLKRVARFVSVLGLRAPNPQWRPFVVSVSKLQHKMGLKPSLDDYQLSQKAIREIFTVLSSFYNYLVLCEKISMNPIALIKQKSKYIQKHQYQDRVMRLSDKQWQSCLETVKIMANQRPEHHERTLFIVSALYLLYLRVSELCASDRWTPEMGHFYQDSASCWWFKTVGKGNKMREIAVPDDMLLALRRYRLSMQLSPLPFVNEKIPLLSKETGKGPMTSSRHLRRLIQDCFDSTIQQLRHQGCTTEADLLESAAVHWLRQTGISDDINKRGRPVAHVRDDAGHSSSAITDRYNDIDLLERHESAKHKKLMTPG
ncbi:MAG: site-specific integrase [Legionellales bacterium]|nr:site-specific integrase [Legionellales bacterium]